MAWLDRSLHGTSVMWGWDGSAGQVWSWRLLPPEMSIRVKLPSRAPRGGGPGVVRSSLAIQDVVMPSHSEEAIVSSGTVSAPHSGQKPPPGSVTSQVVQPPVFQPGAVERFAQVELAQIVRVHAVSRGVDRFLAAHVVQLHPKLVVQISGTGVFDLPAPVRAGTAPGGSGCSGRAQSRIIHRSYSSGVTAHPSGVSRTCVARRAAGLSYVSSPAARRAGGLGRGGDQVGGRAVEDVAERGQHRQGQSFRGAGDQTVDLGEGGMPRSRHLRDHRRLGPDHRRPPRPRHEHRAQEASRLAPDQGPGPRSQQRAPAAEAGWWRRQGPEEPRASIRPRQQPVHQGRGRGRHPWLPGAGNPVAVWITPRYGNANSGIPSTIECQYRDLGTGVSNHCIVHNQASGGRTTGSNSCP